VESVTCDVRRDSEAGASAAVRRDDAAEAVLAAGATLAWVVQEVADDTRASANDDPETEVAAAWLQAALDAWAAASARVGAGDACPWDDGASPCWVTPEPCVDVLAYRDEAEHRGEPIGWDLCYVDARGGWHSATYGDEAIAPPLRWWPMPSLPERCGRADRP